MEWWWGGVGCAMEKRAGWAQWGRGEGAERIVKGEREMGKLHGQTGGIQRSPIFTNDQTMFPRTGACFFLFSSGTVLGVLLC